MSVSIDLYEDSGAVSSGRGSTIALIEHWNLKSSADPAVVYFPTAETLAAPLQRPTIPGQETLSYKKYLSFKLFGTYNKVKNLKISLTANSPTQADKPRLFYKFSNTYQVPDNSYDGEMICASADGVIQVPTLYPMFSTTSPANATTRQVVYGPDQTLYTNFLVLQLRIPSNCSAGNTAEFLLTLSCDEY